MKPKGKITTKKKPERIIFNPNGATVSDPCYPFGSRIGKYAHYCYEHNELLIDETDPEFAACNCGKPNPKT